MGFSLFGFLCAESDFVDRVRSDDPGKSGLGLGFVLWGREYESDVVKFGRFGTPDWVSDLCHWVGI